MQLFTSLTLKTPVILYYYQNNKKYDAWQINRPKTNYTKNESNLKHIKFNKRNLICLMFYFSLLIFFNALFSCFAIVIFVANLDFSTLNISKLRSVWSKLFLKRPGLTVKYWNSWEKNFESWVGSDVVCFSYFHIYGWWVILGCYFRGY